MRDPLFVDLRSFHNSRFASLPANWYEPRLRLRFEPRADLERCGFIGRENDGRKLRLRPVYARLERERRSTRAVEILVLGRDRFPRDAIGIHPTQPGLELGDVP